LAHQALHAVLLGFPHPVTGEILRFESPPPPDMARLIEALSGAF
jgi:23S rRNA pseudouridine1911/1915/1917 synthase